MNTEKNCTIDESKIPLKRSLGLTTAILMVAGIVIGSGVFKKIAPMSAALMNRNYILLAWLLAGIIALLGAFTIAGLATLTDESGAFMNICDCLLAIFFLLFPAGRPFLLPVAAALQHLHLYLLNQLIILFPCRIFLLHGRIFPLAILFILLQVEV